ncbi:MAG: ECF transporter S component [Bacteroidaceae bacterium]|jgi:hypothetical protein|nr:ECF transporter S component [Bacteroidaceae bacterium]
MESTVKLYSLNYKEAKTYLFATLFVLGNIALPQLCHLIPQGGFIFLPIYFFTLIGAYKYGMRVGLLTAILSPIINCLLFGMPALAMLPAILVKSVVLAIAAALIAHRAQKVSLLLMFAVVLTYQFVGGIFEAIQTGSITASLQDVRLGLPGLLFQIFGGWAFIRFLIRK